MTGTFEIIYRHGRRKHPHRCRACDLTLTDGSRAVMARIGLRRTWALHRHCAYTLHSQWMTWRQAFEAWSRAVLVRGKFKVAFAGGDL